MAIFIFSLIILILSVVIHEVAHGAMADSLGDPTARMAGRLSLNPIKHLDPMGSVLIPLILIIVRSPVLFGWAKPVPINPLNFADKKYGELKVALAGPLSNFAIAFSFSMILRFVPLNFELSTLFGYVIFINLILFFFNLLPVPPLDGSHVLFSLLPPSSIAGEIRNFLLQYQFFILIFIVFFAFRFLIPLIFFISRMLVGFPLFF